jgi:hypothetical protein
MAAAVWAKKEREEETVQKKCLVLEVVIALAALFMLLFGWKSLRVMVCGSRWS